MFDDVLDALEVRLEPFAVCELDGDCLLGLGPRSHAILHYVLGGQGEIQVGRGLATPVKQGSMVLVPAFTRHALRGFGVSGAPLPDCKPLDATFAVFKEGQGPRSLTAVCGRVDTYYRGLQGRFPLLRVPIIEHLAPQDRVRQALDEFVQEMAHPAIGTRALARSLLQQCMITLLRRRYQAGDPGVIWIEGLGDEGLWAALKLLLDHPEREHTVESLAAEASLSRSAFAKRFKKAFGIGPVALLKDVRLTRAAEILAISDLPIKRIAELVGYRSRSYFTRLFEASYAVSPDLFRRRLQEADPDLPRVGSG